jgi:phosphohistidine phosphatase
VQRLILLRHAKSDYPLGVPDHDRPLNARGRSNAATIAERLRPFLSTASSVAVAVSTATRAQQTWMIANRDLGLDYWSDRDLYLAEPATILAVASAFDTAVGIVVGHNPGLEDLARSAHGAESIEDAITTQRLRDKFPTSAFAVLEADSDPWEITNVACVGFVVCR